MDNSDNPALGQNHWVIKITHPEYYPDSYSKEVPDKEKITVGSIPSSDIVLNVQNISRTIFALQKIGDYYFLDFCQNGMTLNGERQNIRPENVMVKHDDILRYKDFTFRFFDPNPTEINPEANIPSEDKMEVKGESAFQIWPALHLVIYKGKKYDRLPISNFKLLQMLNEKSPQVWKRQELEDELAKIDIHTDLYTLVSDTKNLLEVGARNELIINIPRVGYKLDPDLKFNPPLS